MTGTSRGMPITEQGMLQDCVFSCVNGRPTYAAILNIFRDDKEVSAGKWHRTRCVVCHGRL